MTGRARDESAEEVNPVVAPAGQGPRSRTVAKRPSRQVLARRWAVLLGLLALVAFAISSLVGGGSPPPRSASGGSSTRTSTSTTASLPAHLVASLAAWHLRAPVSRAVVVTEGSHVVVLGGLTTGDVSTAAVSVLDPTNGAVSASGYLTLAVHDAAGALLGGRAVVFGGGSYSSVAAVQSFAGGHASTVGSLPEARSDLAAAVVGGRGYVLGGFDGTALVRSVLETSDGLHFSVVGQLAQPVRYPAVAVAGGMVWVVGGELGTSESALSGGQTDDVQRFDPVTGKTVVVAHLPETLGHASAVAINGSLFVLGGRHGDALSSHIFRINPKTGAVSTAGTFAYPRSDAAVAVIGSRAYLIGGESTGPTAPLNTVVALRLVGGTSTPADPAAVTAATKTANIYAAAGANMLSPVVRNMPYRIYVPESTGSDVDVINPKTYKVIARYQTGLEVQHVVPAWNLKTLYATNDLGNSLTPISPYTGKPKGPNIPVTDPYNMYFTPNGKYAIVVEEADRTLAFRNPNTFKLEKALPVACAGVDHGDFSADGSFAIFSCEFSGQLVKINLKTLSVAGYLGIPGSSPQDVKLNPQGTIFFVADMNRGGVYLVSAATFKVIDFIPTGRDAHGLYPSRDGRYLYVSNRGSGSISVINLATNTLKTTWHIPGGGSPDMGNVSPDGKVLWLSGRYNDCVYAISTTNGHLLAEIPVPNSPHGLAVWPQPGRYSLGHTGIMR